MKEFRPGSPNNRVHKDPKSFRFWACDARRSLKKIKKRLRKKKHLGEFAKWGRQLIAIRNTKMDADTFQDAFIIEAIEGNECYCGGSLSDDKIDVIVELGRMSENPENKFAKVTAWLDARSDIEGWRAGPLFDLWYGDYEDIDHQSEQTA